jgi:hypothetical protein
VSEGAGVAVARGVLVARTTAVFVARGARTALLTDDWGVRAAGVDRATTSGGGGGALCP